MATLGELIVKIGADARPFSNALNKATKDAQKWGKEFEKIGNSISGVGEKMTTRLTLPIVAAGAAAFKLASDYEEAINKVDVAFGNNAQAVKDWSKTTLTKFGLAKGTALDMAAGYGDMATSMGLSTDEAEKMSTALVGLAGDLASFKNIRIEEANTALTAIFTGETESLKRLGVVMTQVNLEEYALSQGIQKKIKDMTQAEQVQLRYNYVMAKTSNAHGDFERTGGGAANQMRIFTESLKELGATFGENLLPVITPIIKNINELIKRFGALDPEMQKTIITIAGIVAIGGPLLIFTGNTINSIVTMGRTFKTVTSLMGIFTTGLGDAKTGTIAARGGVAALSGAGGLRGLASAITPFIGPQGLLVLFAAGVAAIVGYKLAGWIKETSAAYREMGAEMSDQEWGQMAVEAGGSAPSPADAGEKALWGRLAGGTGSDGSVDYTGDNLGPGSKNPFVDWFNGGGSPSLQVDPQELNRIVEGYDTGGIVPGPLGSPRLAIVHGGEEVLTPAQRQLGGVSTVNHTGTITVKGVNDANQLVGVAQILADDIQCNDRRLPNRVSLIPI